MRRGRPTTAPQSRVSKPSPSPLRGINGDPFAALDSNVPVSVATDDVAARFPSLDQFSLLHDHGAKFEFDKTSPVTASMPKDLNQRVTEKLADQAFVTPPPASGMSRAQKIISSSPALQEAVSVPSTTVQQPTPNKPTPNFTVSASPTSISVARGSSGTSTITTAVSGGFNSAISLSASGQGSAQTVTFSPSSIAAPGSGTSTMTVKVGRNARTGNRTITITATGGGVTHTTTVTLDILR